MIQDADDTCTWMIQDDASMSPHYPHTIHTPEAGLHQRMSTRRAGHTPQNHTAWPMDDVMLWLVLWRSGPTCTFFRATWTFRNLRPFSCQSYGGLQSQLTLHQLSLNHPPTFLSNRCATTLHRFYLQERWASIPSSLQVVVLINVFAVI